MKGKPFERVREKVRPPSRACEALEPRVMLAGDPVDLELVAQDAGTLSDVVVSGNRAYVCVGNHLAVMDVSTPAQPKFLGSILLPGAARDVAVSGNYAYVADDFAGLQIVDVSDPAAPSFVGSYGTPDLAVGVYVAGTNAYVADLSGGVQMVDVASPAAPGFRGVVDTPGRAWAVGVAGNVLYVADEGSGFRQYDISNPAAPGQLMVSTFGTAQALDLTVINGVAYVAWWGANGAAVAYNVATPGTATTVATRLITNVTDIAASGSLVYAVTPSGFRVLELSGSTLTVRATVATATAPSAVFPVGQLAYVAGGQHGLEIFNVATPSSPSRIVLVPMGGRVVDGVVSGTTAYERSRTELLVVDVADPAAPVLKSRVAVAGIADVAVAGNFAYVAASAGLLIYNVSNPAAPALVGTYAMPGAYGLALRGNLAFVTGGSGVGLQVIDVSNPAAPALRGSVDTPGYATGIDVTGNVALVADDTNGLVVVDVSNPAAPAARATFDTPNNAMSVARSGNLAVVCDGYGGLVFVDVSNPAAPVRRGGFAQTGLFSAYDVIVPDPRRALAYVADNFFGLKVIDFSNPAAAGQVGAYPSYDAPFGVFADGPLVYLGDDRGGLMTVRTSAGDPPPTVTAATAPRDQRGDLLVEFSEQVSLNPAAFSVVDLGGQPVATTVGLMRSGWSDAASVRLDRALPDGHYLLKVNAALLKDSGGQAVDGDHDGAPGGTFTVPFVQWRGDANGDRAVDFNDLVVLARNYNQGGGRTWRDGDFTGDGVVDFTDLVALAQNYNAPMPAPATTASISLPATARETAGGRPAAAPARKAPTTRAVFSPARIGADLFA